MREKTPRRSVRNAVAFSASLVVHLLTLLALLVQGAPDYQLPTPPEAPPVEVEIIPPTEILRAPPIPKAPIPKTPNPTVRPPLPVPPPPAPQQPAPAPSPPAPTPKPAPPKVVLARPLAAPTATPQAPVVAKPAPPAVLNALPLPSLAPVPAPAPPTPKPAATPAPAPVLNVHKPKKEAPAGTPTLPMAPSPSQPPSGGGGSPASGGEPAIGGSRLQGLVPYPPGMLPNGGGGLRGSLVGCANAQAVGLSSVERAHCEQRFGAAAASAPHLDGIAPARRSEFDQQVERAERDRNYRNSTTSSALTGLGGVSPDQTTTTVKIPK